MHLTFFSFMMSVLWSSAAILLVHLFRRKQFFLNGFGVTTIVLLYVFSLARMFFAIEFTYAWEVPVPMLYNRFYSAVQSEVGSLGGRTLNVFHVFLLVWCAVAVVLIAVFLVRYLTLGRFNRRLHTLPDDTLTAILADIQAEYGSRLRIRISRCAEVTMPMGTGLRSKQILIPMAQYTEEELRFILLHEFMHFRNKDLQILFLTEIFAKLFWWNPFVYLFRADIRQILEIRCDLSVVHGMDPTQRTDYLRAIRTCLIEADRLRSGQMPAVSTQLIRPRKNGKAEEMLERFKLIAYPVKKNYTRFQVLSIVLGILLLVLSYSFILQPQFETPEEEIYTDSGVENSQIMSGYILAKKDGTYFFIDDSGFEMEMSKENVVIFVSDGFEIVEE